MKTRTTQRRSQLRQFRFFIVMAFTIFCGLSPAWASDFSPRIVGGSDTSINDAPATVALIDNTILSQTGSYFQSQFCGGTVIDSRWVITAAHCLVINGSVRSASGLSVLMGSTDLNAPVNQPVGVARIILHPQYNPEVPDNDIALVQLQFDAFVQAVGLDSQAPRLNDLAFIAGWGALESVSPGEQQPFPSRLQSAYVRMIPGTDCEQMFASYRGQVSGRQLCAGRASGGVDTCQGDSGGPLYRADENGRVVALTGITSWGYRCADAQAPGVYTRIGAYLDWIEQNTGNGGAGGLIPVNDPGQTPVPANNGTSTGFNAFDDVGSGAAFVMLPLLALLLLSRPRSR